MSGAAVHLVTAVPRDGRRTTDIKTNEQAEDPARRSRCLTDEPVRQRQGTLRNRGPSDLERKLGDPRTPTRAAGVGCRLVGVSGFPEEKSGKKMSVLLAGPVRGALHSRECIPYPGHQSRLKLNWRVS